MDFKLLYSFYSSTKYKSKETVSLLTYEDSHSPAMKQTIHINGVDNLVEESNIFQNKQECQTMEYDKQLLCCSCKITEIERKHIMRKHRKKHMYDSMEPVANWCIQYCFLYCQLFNLF